MSVYRAGMAGLPLFGELSDVPTSFGTVRAYRFDGPSSALNTPVLLLPGRNASTPMYAVNLPPLLEHRTVYSVDLLGEAGFSVQNQPITGPDDQAQWLDETLAGLALERAHLLGVSIGGWTATNCAVRRPGRVASLTLLDPAMTFAPIPIKAILASSPCSFPACPTQFFGAFSVGSPAVPRSTTHWPRWG
jgi:pimeloyl-ACP methyl ester carboxylesterase